jgi:hypothetical protein
MAQLSPKAIIVGGIVDVGSSIVLGIPLVYYVLTKIGISGAPGPGAETGVIAAIHSSPVLRPLQLVIGCACSVLGGYVAARIARRDHLVNALLASWLCAGIGIYSIVVGKGADSLWLQTLLIGVTFACYALGGYIRLRSVPRRSAPA